MPYDRRALGGDLVVRNSLRKHERRLRVVFQRALVLALAPAAALQACADDTIVGTQAIDGGDATTSQDGAGSDQASADGEAGMGDGGREAALSDRTAVPDAATDADTADAGDATTDGLVEADEADAEGPWCADASIDAPWWSDASGSCRYYVPLSCAQFKPLGNCLLSASDCLTVCTLSNPLFDCEYAQPACTIGGRFVAEAGQPVEVQCDLCPGAGRRPEGLRRLRPRTPGGSALGEYFAQAAHLEAASVHAFRWLEHELRAHGAPRWLVNAARRSSMDETRHAVTMGRFAARHGTRPPSPRLAASKVRTLERIARENAVEGCVRETYGAVLATWQAAHATDAGIRRCFARLAADETRHAALAWAVAEWVDGRLDAAARARLARARRGAVRRLVRETAGEPPRALAALLGLPSARQARVLQRGAQMTRDRTSGG
jgi:hypothetical protein